MDGEDGRQLSMAWRDEIRMLDSEVRTLMLFSVGGCPYIIQVSVHYGQNGIAKLYVENTCPVVDHFLF